MKYSDLFLRAAAYAIFPIAALARSPSAPASDPTDPRAPFPPVVYESPFAGYRSIEGQPAPPAEWRERNESVGKTSGMAMEGMNHGSMDGTDKSGLKVRVKRGPKIPPVAAPKSDAKDGVAGANKPSGDAHNH